MRYIDWLAQTLILITGVVLVIFDLHRSDPIPGILIAQLMLGPWQLASSAISVIRKSNLWKYKRIHLLLASCYLILIYVFAHSTISVFENSRIAWLLFLTIPSMSLAAYYYFLTWKSTFISTTKRGSFLPNINF